MIDAKAGQSGTLHLEAIVEHDNTTILPFGSKI